jgi:hypothetical protein
VYRRGCLDVWLSSCSRGHNIVVCLSHRTNLLPSSLLAFCSVSTFGQVTSTFRRLHHFLGSECAPVACFAAKSFAASPAFASVVSLQGFPSRFRDSQRSHIRIILSARTSASTFPNCFEHSWRLSWFAVGDFRSCGQRWNMTIVKTSGRCSLTLRSRVPLSAGHSALALVSTRFSPMASSRRSRCLVCARYSSALLE